MNPLLRTQETAARFNEEEAVWQCYRRKRETRRVLGGESAMDDAALDRADWLAAEKECRTLPVLPAPRPHE
ncbi:MAG TPA: hypothetical protein VGO11_21290 [Chthoniobacteraceae bacterium]|jgi:hypothetical protein|nr:hypothetical protein [Chthoniobacteraceae bacterium]